MKTTKHLIIFGPPGSGKGTQAKIIKDKFNLYLFGTGDLMRQEAEKGTQIGQKFQAIWDRGQGELVSDDLVDAFVTKKTQDLDLSQGVIFDGYPRTIKQAENLAHILNTAPENIIIINIKVPADLLINRMQTRRVCSNCGKVFFKAEESGIKKCDDCGSALIQRQEDQSETIRKRIEIYEKQTQPVLDYYKNKAVLLDIDGAPKIEKVTAEIEEKLNKILK
ncbi:MAG: Adenylate kinase [Berkelbacteria bacterium GW2011_GWA1_36_9]|uniref:Adenylate kinase n=1 Tax=Berkelbacteria bacterium GW2011_GWA1_36_9 TaxID=1618331 RepID=A0A0G0FKI0_9BACT|nr:MAG: Adenylate kinase [Berkelbacteria bacterium GW2011_GWA1_36_9]